MRLIGSLVAAGLLLATAGGARARPGNPPQPGVPAAAPPGWQFSITPYVRPPALRGTRQTPLPRLGEPSAEIGSGTVLTNRARVPVMLAGEVVRAGWRCLGVDIGLSIGAGVGANRVGGTDLSRSGALTARLRENGYAAPGGSASFDAGVVVVGSIADGVREPRNRRVEIVLR